MASINQPIKEYSENMIKKTKKTLKLLSDSHGFAEMKDYIDTLMEMDINLVKKIMDHDFYGTMFTTHRDHDRIDEYIEIGQKLNIDFMDSSSNNSILQRVLKYTTDYASRKKLIGKIAQICITQNQAKFIEIVKKTEMSDIHKITIIDTMWKQHGKSLKTNFDEILNYVSSGVQITGESCYTFTLTPSISVKPVHEKCVCINHN